jgi:hypothetical protein
MTMKKDGWKALVGVVGTAALGASSACTITTGPYNPDAAVYFGDDGSLGDTGSDAAVVADTGLADAGAGTDGAVTCTVPAGANSCETCVLQHCCSENQACTSGPMNDAGNTDCEDIAQCFNDCRHPPVDSGVAGDTIANCTTTCTAGHTAQGATSFQALETCTSQSCSFQCQ